MEAYIPKRKTDIRVGTRAKKSHLKTRLLVLSGILLTIPLFSFAYNRSYPGVSIPQNQTTTGPIIYSVCPNYGCGRTAHPRQVNTVTNVYGQGYTESYVAPETQYVRTYPTTNITTYKADTTRQKGSPAWGNGEWTVDSPGYYNASLDQTYQSVRPHGAPAW